MLLSHRKNIVRRANRLIENEIKNFKELPSGKRESIQDKYIKRVCEEKDWTIRDFYNEDGYELEKLLRNV